MIIPCAIAVEHKFHKDSVLVRERSSSGEEISDGVARPAALCTFEIARAQPLVSGSLFYIVFSISSCVSVAIIKIPSFLSSSCPTNTPLLFQIDVFPAHS